MAEARWARACDGTDPEILFFDEPSSGLDPITARRLDDLIIELRDSLNTTLVIVSHDLASIFATATEQYLTSMAAKDRDRARRSPKSCWRIHPTRASRRS